ncbi:MAG: MBOAT family protein [Eubacterium sp.]|nr:MBOAT family protein [Eubacterium sp.]
MVLLVSSLAFYVCAGKLKILFAFVGVIAAYLASGRISSIYSDDSLDKQAQKKKAKPYLVAGVIILVLLLLFFKVAQRTFSSLYMVLLGKTITISMLVPLGISYYTFSLIGYMADVYWRKTSHEKNILHLLLYAIYFPQIVEGPIPRHKALMPKLLEGHDFDYNRVTFGLQRVLWGLFKKMVIADRAALMTAEVFGNHLAYSGIFYLLAVLASAIQLYADFSGCMDIALGVSEMFGIELTENFKRPFYSTSAAEFWRRWHITLGAWFKDYVYMPLVISPWLLKISKKFRDKWGIRAGKNVMTVIPLFIVWILTGLWHGTGLGYIIWGLYWGLIIILSTVLEPELKKLNGILHINAESSGWKRFQRIRTFLIFSGGRLLTAPGSLRVSGAMVKSFFRDFNPWIFASKEIYNAGLSAQNMWCLIIALLVMAFVSYRQECGVKIRERVASYPIALRWIIYFALIYAIIIFGIYGPGYSSSAFVYSQY